MKNQEPFIKLKNYLDRVLAPERRQETLRRWIELLSTVLLALATVATAWSAYQSARWGGRQTAHSDAATLAIIRTSKFTNLAEQKLSLQADLFSQWLGAVGTNNPALADFMLARFPEPLKTATVAWQATKPLTNPAAPLTPFQMPEYALPETLEADRWEAVADDEFEAADTAGTISDHYLLFTIVFASVLFFAGVSGKFGWQVIDWTVLLLGTIALLTGLVILFSTPML